jgi:hypothetical protein
MVGCNGIVSSITTTSPYLEIYEAYQLPDDVYACVLGIRAKVDAVIVTSQSALVKRYYEADLHNLLEIP